MIPFLVAAPPLGLPEAALKALPAADSVAALVAGLVFLLWVGGAWLSWCRDRRRANQPGRQDVPFAEAA